MTAESSAPAQALRIAWGPTIDRLVGTYKLALADRDRVHG